MRISIATEDGDCRNLEVDSGMELENIKALIEAEFGVSSENQIILHNGRELNEAKVTLQQVGVVQDDILLLKLRQQTNNSQSRNPGADEAVRRHILGNPRLLQHLAQTNPELAQTALRDPQRFVQTIENMARQQREQEVQSFNDNDPFSIEMQRRIEEEIRMNNIMENLNTAMEYNPEFFGRVTMLYINCQVNGHPVKAFVDSGAQMTIMSPECAEKCNIMRLVDTRFSGIARGVGTAKILGRVHSAHIRVGKSQYLACAFTIMEGKGVDLLFGLDMLKRHQACIDLKRNALVINDEEIPFLSEHELPEEARAEWMGEEMSGKTPAITTESTTTSSSATSSSLPNLPTQAQGAASLTTSRYPEESIRKLMEFGVSREEAINALDVTGGNVDMAADLLFS
ncbi:uncharacterized protein VTP21DRAFT_2368 [Calcarisporiella thermophila]|uniref:uncharacterized protein n=1 Tax=Calcarisporiella thermophila TaxID=911321 RepID=UPI00374289D8